MSLGTDRFPVVVVHGVGYCAADQTSSTVKGELKPEDHGRVVVHEVYWGNLLDPKHAATNGPTLAVFDTIALARINRSLLAASLIDFDNLSIRTTWHRLLLAVDRVTFYLTCICLFAIPAFFFILGLDIAVLFIWGASLYPFSHPFAIEGWYLFVAATLCFASLISGSAVQSYINRLPRLQSLMVAVRRVGLALISQLYTALAIPFTSWLLMGSAFVGGICYVLSVVSVPAWLAVYGYLRFAGSNNAVNDMPSIGMTLIALGLIVLACGATVLVAGLIVRLFAPIMKILADIAMYLGDVKHQRELLTRVGRSLETANWRQGPAVLCGHSLGSMILIDYLRHEQLWCIGQRRVVLITMGSPALRLFYRFFPRQYSHPSVIANQLRTLSPAFTWINIYRPLDPIGGKLSLPKEQWTRDVSTGQLMLNRLLRGDLIAPHVSYFKDRAVHSIAREFVGMPSETFGQEVVVPPLQTDGRLKVSQPEYQDAARALRPLRIIAALSGVMFFASLIVWALVFVPLTRHAVMLRRCQEIASVGVESTGTVRATHSSNLWLPGTNIPLGKSSYLAEVTFRPNGVRADITSQGLLTDDAGVFRWAEEGGEHVMLDPLFTRHFRRNHIRVIYDRNDPSTCIFPDYIQKPPTLWSQLSVWTGILLMSSAALIAKLQNIQVGGA